MSVSQIGQLLRDLPIRAKLMWFATTVTATALLLVSVANILHDMRTSRDGAVRDLESIANILGANTAAALTFDDPITAKELLTSLRGKPMVESACLYDRTGRPFATFRQQEYEATDFPTTLRSGHAFRPDGSLELFTSVSDGDEIVGTLYLHEDMATIQAQTRHHLAMVVLVLVVALSVAIGLALRLQDVVSRPIRELAETASRISKDQDYSLRVVKSGQDEIGELYDAFNEMLSHIETAQQQLQHSYDQLEVRVAERTRQLTETNTELHHEIEERHRAEQELRDLQQQHLQAARQAGMAEIATSVLHNVGNVLNSVNVSSNLVAEKLRKSGVHDLCRATELMKQHQHDLDVYITQDERGRHLAPFLIELSRQMAIEEESIQAELQSLLKNVDHIKDIIALQQSNAGMFGLIQEVALDEVIEDAIQINLASMQRDRIEVVREFEELPRGLVDKQKVLQILINLVSNAKQALRDSDQVEKQMIVRLQRCGVDRVRIEVIDNGTGISAENLTKIFAHGFTTKKDGHGFGLHGSALHAAEMDGKLRVHSDGLGTGATFTLEIPLNGNFTEENKLDTTVTAC